MKKNKGNKGKKSLAEIARQKSRVRRVAPTESWVEAVVYGGEKLPTGWLECERCGHQYPPYYLSNGRCYDCHLCRLPRRGSDLPPSNSIIRPATAA